MHIDEAGWFSNLENISAIIFLHIFYCLLSLLREHQIIKLIKRLQSIGLKVMLKWVLFREVPPLNCSTMISHPTLLLAWWADSGSLHSNLPSFVITYPCDTHKHTHIHTISKTCQCWQPCDRDSSCPLPCSLSLFIISLFKSKAFLLLSGLYVFRVSHIHSCIVALIRWIEVLHYSISIVKWYRQSSG